MKLSEAIRAGSAEHPQGFGQLERARRKYFFGLIGPVVREVCALGAAFKAEGCGTEPGIAADNDRPFRGTATTGALTSVVQVSPEWNRVMHAASTCPQCGQADPVYRLIPHLNDAHRWKREEIAFFVEGVETIHEAAEAFRLADEINDEDEIHEAPSQVSVTDRQS